MKTIKDLMDIFKDLDGDIAEILASGGIVIDAIQGAAEKDADETDRKMMDLLGADVWDVIKFNADLYGFRVRFINDAEIGLTYLDYDPQDERIISKLELLEFFYDDVDALANSLYSDADAEVYKKDLVILQNAIAVAEAELYKPKAIRLEDFMKSKAVGKILDNWMDLKSYTVYKDDFNQLYYIDEVKAKKVDRIECINPITLHDIIKLVIADKERIQKEFYNNDIISELYSKDLKILKAYARW